MNSAELKELVKLHLEYGSGDSELGSLYVEGPPGVGKSEMINQAALESDAKVVDFRLSLRDPVDLRGIPYPDPENDTARWLPPSEMPRERTHGKKGILFFDDIHTAPSAVQSAAYQITIKPHQLGEYTLPEGWLVVAAGNRAQDKSGAQPMQKALANRFRHVTYDLDRDAWIDWAASNGVHEQIISFIASPAAESSNGNLLFQFNPSKEEKAFPTPRSWVAVSSFLHVAENNLSENVIREAVKGSVGEAASTQFFTFQRLYHRLPDPNQILIKGNFEVTPTETDLKYALVVAVAQRAEGKQFNNAIKWANASLLPELGVLLLRMLSARDRTQVLKAPEFAKWARNNEDAIR